MEFNFVGIDPSLVSTAVVVNGNLFNYCRESDATTKNGLGKWFKLCEQYVEYKWIKYRSFENYSEGEIFKIKDYDNITNKIVEDILDTIDKSKPTKVAIEGYNFGAQVGDLIDLVTFSTLLRKKLFDVVTEDITVISPTSLKSEACKLTYPPIDTGKKKEKLIWRNSYGISGGNFTKREMFLSIVENETWTDKWAIHCKSVKDEVLENKTVKKPYEDLNDAYLLWRFIQSTTC